MSFIVLPIDLNQYVERIEHQREMLEMSPLFNEEERKGVLECYDELLVKCYVIMARQFIESTAEKENKP